MDNTENKPKDKPKDKPKFKPVEKCGGMRRKIKVVRNINSAFKKSKEELQVISKIRSINKMLENVDDEYAILARNGIEDIYYSYLQTLERYDFKSKDMWKEAKKDFQEFFEKKFILFPYSFMVGIYSEMTKIFIKDCMPHFAAMFTEIETYMEKDSYKVQEAEKEEMTDKQCFDILELDISVTPTKAEVRKAFREKSFANHPDKKTPDEREKYEEIYKDISIAYKLILSRHNL